MAKINIQNWKDFTLETLFTIVKGSRLTKKDMIEGNINYIGATAFNNGITNHIGNNEHIHPAGTLTVTYNGSIGQTFYQEKDFWATDDVNVLYPKFTINKYIALFIAPLIKAVGKNYEYTDKWQIEDMKKSKIYLPVDENNLPDFDFMESYMKEKERNAKIIIKQLFSIIGGGKQLKSTTWKFYKIGTIFDAKNTGNILARDVLDGSGHTPYVTASAMNNGVVAHIDASNYQKITGHCILVGGKTFTLTYQCSDFVSNDSHNFVLRLKENVSEKAYLFILTILKVSFTSKYSWDDAVTKEKILEEYLLLPTKNGGLDWNFMDSYMRTVENKAKTIVSKCTQICYRI